MPDFVRIQCLLTCLLLGWLGVAPLVAQSVTLSGTVREAGTGELLAGVTVWLPDSRQGTTTNAYGFFSLSLPADQLTTIVWQHLGFAADRQVLLLAADRQVTVTLTPKAAELAEVAVTGSASPPDGERMSVVSLPLRQLQQMPMLLGEKDVIKALQLLPGVQKGREGQTGLYVRGGGPDQNLLLLDDAVVYNASHLFGFFSVFNADALRSVTLTKGGFPARYGGRLSSVVEMQMKEGNRQQFHGTGGVGLLSGRLTLEGPIQRNKSSFLVSGRRSYLDVLLRPLSGGTMPKVYFYDLTLKASADVGPRDRLFISSYLGRDAFHFSEKSNGTTREDGFDWGNATASLRWNHVYSPTLFGNATLVFSRYDFTVFNQQTAPDGLYALRYTSGIRDLTAKLDFDYRPGQRHALTFGGQLTAHQFTPSALVRKQTGPTAGVPVPPTPPIDAVESALYIDDSWKPTDRLTLTGGLRYSGFQVAGRAYQNLEPRLSSAYRITENLTVKASYARMNQFIQLLSNSGPGLPTDLWVPATDRIPPQRADQWAIGAAGDLARSGLTLTVEAFYKRMHQLVGYREGASFLLLDAGPDAQRTSAVDWQENVTTGQGRAYGVEWLMQRKTGRLSGWVGYTLAWIHHRFPDVNAGQDFFPRYDRRHDLSVVGIYQVSRRITGSATFVYGTGNALTLPVARSALPEHSFTGYTAPVPVDQYGPANSFRAAAYHRLDLSIQFKKPLRRGERQWEIGVYNVYNRVNPFYYESRSAPATDAGGQGTTKLFRRGLFPVIPSITYSRSF